MNFKEAIDILELPENYSIDILKKNYKRLAVKYHPDKYSGDSSKFIKINDSYNFLLKRMNGTQEGVSIDNIIADFLKNFHNFQFIKIHTIPIFPIIPNPKNSIIHSEFSDNITIVEYLSGFVRKYSSNQECNCEPLYCVDCLGLGIVQFNNICNTCNGSGAYKNCGKCKLGMKMVTYKFKPLLDLSKSYIINNKEYSFKLVSDGYSIIDNKIIYKIDSIKNKFTFTDPLGKEHLIDIKGTINNGDAYKIILRILTDNIPLYLLF